MIVSATQHAPLTPSSGKFFTTNFPLTENPISEGGVWVRGRSEGIDWTDPRTNGTICFGTQTPHTNPPDDDSIAHLTGFGPDHFAQGTVHTTGVGGTMEFELLVRATIVPHSAILYEFDFLNDGRVFLARWNGALNNFTVLNGNSPIATLSIHDGDVMKATASGNILTLHQGGVLKATYDLLANFVGDGSSIISTGNPGMGYWYVDTGAASSDFCFSSFTAQS